LSAAFDLIEARIAEFGDGGAAIPPTTQEASPSPAPATSDIMSTAAMETETAATAAENADAAIASPAASSASDMATAETVEMAAGTAASAEDVDAMAEGDDVSAEAADAYDESVLDLIALEMADPEPSDLDDVSEMETDEIHVAELLPAEPVMLAQRPEPILAPAPPPVEPSRQPAPQPAVQPSLGSSLIASGIVRRPATSGADPLAPIRRMSQAEKIAFFS
jgi:hypothetical protein